MATLVLTVVGTDRAGLVAALAEAVSDHGGNWEHSQLAELAGQFAGIVSVSVPDDRRDELIAALEPLHGLLKIAVQEVAPEGPDAALAQRREEFALDLVGNDHPGIVQEISAVLADHGVSFDRLETETGDAPMAGGRLFRATATLFAPADLDVDALTRDLERLARELMVEVTFHTV